MHRAGETSRAIETVRQAIVMNPEFDWAWQVLAGWSTEPAAVEDLLNFVRAFAESRPREVHAWIRLADLALRAQRPNDALAAVDRAITVNPHHITAHDTRAVVLVHLRRFREAEAACKPEALANRVPLLLQGRAAWVDAQRGDLTGAIARMQAVVTQTPDYAWGWAQLVEWHAALGHLDRAADAASRWAWLSPSFIVPLGWLGDLKQRSGDRAAAKEVFERAMRLEPDYLFAGMRFFGIQKQQQDYEGAARTLEILRPYMNPADLEVARIELDVAQSNRDSALARIRNLCRDTAIESHTLSNAIDVTVRGDWQVPLERMLRKLLDEQAWNAATPWLWSRVRVRRGRLGGWRDYRRLVARGEPGKRAMHELLLAIGNLAKQNRRGVLYGWYLDWHIARIAYLTRGWRDDVELWGKLGFALLCRGRSRLVARQLRDWRRRPAAESWMLQNLVLAHFALGRDAEALAVLRHIVSTYSMKIDIGYRLKLWGALGAGLDGELPVAERLLHETPIDTVPESDRPLRHLAEAFVEIARTKPDKEGLTAKQRQALQGAASMPRQTAASRLSTLVRYRIARETRDLRGRLIAWKELNPKAAFAILAGGVVLLLRLLAMLPG